MRRAERGGCQTDPDADRYTNLAVSRLQRRQERISHPGRSQVRSVRAGQVLDQDREFVSAQVRDGIALTHERLEPPSDGREGLIADFVPERIVDELEVVDIDEQQGDQLACASPSRQRVSEPISKQRPVREPRRESCK